MSAMPSLLQRQPFSGERSSRHHSHQLAHSLILMLFLFAGLLGNLATAIPARASASGKGPSIPPPPVSHMTVSQFLQEGQQDKAYHGPLIRPSKALTVPLSPKDKPANLAQLPPGAEPASMKPLLVPLSSSFTTLGATGQPLDLKGSDGRLEVQLPVGSLDLSHASVSSGGVPTGSLTLQITQIHGYFIGQMNELGDYSLQVVDSKGQPVNGIVLRTPATFLYHYNPAALQALDVNANHILMTWPSLIQSAQTAKQPLTSLIIPLSNDPRTHTLSGQSSVLGPGPFDQVSTPQVQNPPPTLLASVNGNTGQLSYAYPLQVPPGADGFAPQLSLVYSSMDPNGRPSRTSPANDEGEGWSLTLGSISMANYSSLSAAPGTWYFLNDVANVSDRLVPDGTANFYMTQHLSYLRIQQIPASQSGTGLPCFNIWNKDGTYYQLGCTSDSVQFYNNNGTQTPYRWEVNKIIAPNDNNGSYKLILVSYLQDCVPNASPCPSGNTVRDDGIAQITYGTGTDTNTISTLDGTIDFAYHAPSQSQWATAYGNNYHCSGQPTTTTLRCDDPLADGSAPAPSVMSTLTLDSVTSYVGADSSSSNTAFQYSFTYSDTHFSGCNDPKSLDPEYCAGEHLLTAITPSVYQDGTAHQLPGMSFGYTQAENFYWDTENNNDGGGNYNAQNYWQYLTSYMNNDTGVGETIAYGTAYSNAHGTPWVYDSNGNLDDRHDPLYCWNHRNDATSAQCTNQSGGYNYEHAEDHAWSVQVVTSITSTGKDSSAGKVKPATTSYQYQLAVSGSYTSGSTFCYPGEGPAPTPSGQSDCVYDTWLPVNEGNPNSPIDDGDWIDYYHGEFHGFAAVLITSPASNLTVDTYYSTEGWFTASSNSGNYNSGALREEDVYEGNKALDSALLQKTVNTYTLSPNSCHGSLDATYNPCEIMVLSSRTTTYEGTGSGNGNAPWVETDYTYDDFNPSSGLQAGYHNVTKEVISSSNAPTLTRKWSYTTTDSGEPGSGSIYYDVNKVTHSEIDDASGTVWQCQDTTYDQGAPSGVSTPDAGWPTKSKSYSDCANQSNTAITSYQGYDAYGNPVASVDGVATANSSLYSSNGCTLSSAPSIFPNGWSQPHYSGCTSYDSYLAQPATVTNALSQISSLSYDYTQGALPTSATDPNKQTTTTAYSYGTNSATNGKRIVQVSEPGETGSYTNESSSKSTCNSGSTLPCFEIDSDSSLYPNAVTETFYDALGREVETRTPGPVSGDDTVVFTLYNDSANSTLTSVPFEVADGSGYVDPNTAVYVGTSTTPGGTVTFADALGRVLAVQDPGYGTLDAGQHCSSTLTGAYTACTNYLLAHPKGASTTYEAVQSVDANSHSAANFIDALGRTRYTQQYNGSSSGSNGLPANSSANEQKTIQYNVLDEPTSVTDTDLSPQSNETVTSVTTTASYDSLGRMTQLVDPERGTHNDTYDADGRLLSDVSGTRTLGYSYDLLGSVGCIQDQAPPTNATGACGSGVNPYVINTYDTNILGTKGSTDFPIGQLTQSEAINYFPSPDNTQGNVTEQMQYDKRGRLTNATLLISATGGNLTFPSFPTYQLSQSYNDADQPTTTTTSSNPSGLGYSFTNFYDSTTGVPTGLGTSSSSADLATLSYNQNALLNTINFQTSTNTSLAQEQFSYDANLRPTQATATWLSGSGTSGIIYSQSLGYDAASNITSSTTTQAVVSGATNSGGSETEIYCYDEQNRLIWAGNSGTPQGASNGTCGSGTPSNSLSNASYSNQYLYTHLGQLWQGPYNSNGSYQYLYCNSSQPHQLTGLYPTGTTCSTIGSKTQTYGASYDSWGNLTTRTASGSGGTTATLSYDGQDQLVRWNDTKNSNNEEWYLYDASGQRVLRRSQTGTGNSNTTYTITAFGLEDHIYNGAGSNLNNKYYYALAGRLVGFNNGSPNFLFTDALGSVVSSITTTANSASVKGNQVYGPYGNNPYSKGTMGTTRGYTGHYNDSLTQLDDYGARYYDPLVGVFLSADTVQGNLAGMNPYSYVGENPETNTDPSGQMIADFGEGGGGVDAGEAAAFESGSGGSSTDASSSTPIPYFSPESSAVEDGNTTINYDANTGELTTQVENADGSTTWSEVEPGTQEYTNDLQTFESLSEGSPDESANAFAQGQTVEGGPTQVGEASDTGLASDTTNPSTEPQSQGENSPNKVLWRAGNEGSPKLGSENLRPDREFVANDVDENGNPMLRPGQKIGSYNNGFSFFNDVNPALKGRWWTLGPNTPLPDGLRFVNDFVEANGLEHWAFDVTRAMTESEYSDLVSQIIDLLEKTMIKTK